MPEDPHLARIEERLEQHIKRFDRHESAVERAIIDLRGDMGKNFQSFEKLMREGIDSAITIQETKNAIYRTVVSSACAAILGGFILWLVSEWRQRPVSFPTEAPSHSTQEYKERPLK